MTSNRSLFAATLGITGIAVLGYANWRLWQEDKAVMACREALPALPPFEMWKQLPRVSILVAAWNEYNSINQLISSFHQLRYPSKELILCAGGQDGTYEFAIGQANPGVVVLKQESGEGKQVALNRCFQRASGEVIFLTDADCWVDNHSFEHTIYPVACEGEKASSGFHRPYTSQFTKPLAAGLAASRFYAAWHSPDYSPGLTGANCAIDRSFLEQSGGLNAEASTGTDYVMAKMLTRANGSIRVVHQSQIATEYPETIRPYVRQQRRWLRNVALHGKRFNAEDEARSSLKTSIVGLAMLLLPFGAVILGPEMLVLWLLLMAHAFSSRLRYLRFASLGLGLPINAGQVAMQIPVMLVDFIAWSLTLFDYLSTKRRSQW